MQLKQSTLLLSCLSTVSGQDDEPTNFKADFSNLEDDSTKGVSGSLELGFSGNKETSLTGKGIFTFQKSGIKTILEGAATAARAKKTGTAGDETADEDFEATAVKAEGCEIKTGLSYHIHKAWTYDDSFTKFGGSVCGGDFTSGHYDPVGDIGTSKCKDFEKNNLPENVNDICELGDLSNRYGLDLVENGEDMDITIAFTDSTFNEKTTVAEFVDDVKGKTDRAEKLSIVFHACGTRFTCAPLLSVAAAGDGNDPTDELNSSKSLDLNIFLMVVMGVLAVL